MMAGQGGGESKQKHSKSWSHCLEKATGSALNCEKNKLLRGNVTESLELSDKAAASVTYPIHLPSPLGKFLLSVLKIPI